MGEFFEKTSAAAPDVPGRTVSGWLLGEVAAYLNRTSKTYESLRITPQSLADMLVRLNNGEINAATAKSILATLLEKGGAAGELIKAGGLQQTTDRDLIASLVACALQENPVEVESYHNGKEAIANWLFGQVMRLSGGKANPQMVREELARQLKSK